MFHILHVASDMNSNLGENKYSQIDGGWCVNVVRQSKEVLLQLQYKWGAWWPGLAWTYADIPSSETLNEHYGHVYTGTNINNRIVLE
jgi:hypothetical protein